MSQAVSFSCSDCQKRIEDMDCPVVCYMVAGLAPLHPLTLDGKGAADVTDFPMPQIVRDLLAQPIARMDFCPECLAEKLNFPMVDKDGKEVKPKAVPKAVVKKAVTKKAKTSS